MTPSIGRFEETGVPGERRRIALAFGSALRARRKLKRISQEELAEQIDIDRTYPSLLERGLRQPTFGIIVALARALDVTPEELVADAVARLIERPAK